MLDQRLNLSRCVRCFVRLCPPCLPLFEFGACCCGALSLLGQGRKKVHIEGLRMLRYPIFARSGKGKHTHGCGYVSSYTSASTALSVALDSTLRASRTSQVYRNAVVFHQLLPIITSQISTYDLSIDALHPNV